MKGKMFLPWLLTCSGVAVMGLGIWGPCVAEAGLGDGVLAGEAGARYLTTAGSTSGVPWKTNGPIKHGYGKELKAVECSCVFPLTLCGVCMGDSASRSAIGNSTPLRLSSS